MVTSTGRPPFAVGILGATGVVGQRLIERLESHPWFDLRGLAASERSVGHAYGDIVRWSVSADPPPCSARHVLREARPEAFDDCDLVLSALDADVGRELEPRFAKAGFAVVSNSSALRMEPDVPLLVPEINAAHLELLESQRRRTGGGFVVTNPNCSVTGLALAVAPLARAFGLRRAVVVTLQALSGAGLNGPRGLEIVDNVLPFIPGEEEKIERELAKILGQVEDGAMRPAPIAVSAHCHRVASLDGHLEAVSLELARTADPSEAVRVLRDFDGGIAALELPSSVARPIVVRDEPDRPQPRLDRLAGGGMSVVVGRVRICPVLGLKLELLSHNMVRGVAGATLLNAELLVARDLVPRRAST